jgi:hypothetical protein
MVVFSVAAYFVMGWRASFWDVRVFLTIPIVVCLFSYLYSACVLIGVVTRSTLASLLLTLLFWGVVFLVGWAETNLLAGREVLERQLQGVTQSAASFDSRIARLRERGDVVTQMGQSILQDFEKQRLEAIAQREEASATMRRWETMHGLTLKLKTILPKTIATTDLLDRWLLTVSEWKMVVSGGKDLDAVVAAETDRRKREFAQKLRATAYAKEIERQRSIAWVVGTSLAFEAVVLALAAWSFCRRDF